MLKLIAKLALAAYATLVAVFGQYAALDSLSLGYSPALVALTSLSAISLAAAVLIVVLELRAQLIVRYWKPVFWLSCADIVIGTAMDWGSLSSSLWPRLLLLFVLACFLGPAYYISYAVAYKSNRGSSGNGA